MSDNQEIKKVNGTWKGIPCNIRAVWGKNDVWEGHEFTADERAALFNDETIEFEAISKEGKPYTAKGKLEKIQRTDKDGKEFEYVGFTLKFDNKPEVEKFEGTWNGKKVKVTRTWSGHRFTDEEVKDLLAGKNISFEATRKDGSTYTAQGVLEEQEYNGNKFVGFKIHFT